VRSLAVALTLASVAYARPHAQPQPKQLHALAAAPPAQKLIARDAADVRLLILASPS
jgi:hypothetical protein